VGETVPPESAWKWVGGEGEPLVFTHANGFPPETYLTLLQALLPHFRVATFASRPLWSTGDPEHLESWHPMAADLEEAIEDHVHSPVVALGHSLGGMLCALAAVDRPDLISTLVLLDPVVFSGTHGVVWGWMKRFGMGRRFPLVRGALRRRDTWPDRNALRMSWTGKSVFRRWDRRVFEDYLESGVSERPDGSLVLRYPKAWEARIFEVCPHDEWSRLRRIPSPVLVVRGEASDTLLPAAARRLERELPDAQVVDLEGTSHFLPMERPDEVARLIIEFASGVRC
jgi:pimeloyl-ACP methyl ester carboxylesterase